MLINLRNALMTGKRLPYDAEVEYLESTGTQWIDTGVVADSDTRITIGMSLPQISATTVSFGAAGMQSNIARNFSRQYFGTTTEAFSHNDIVIDVRFDLDMDAPMKRVVLNGTAKTINWTTAWTCADAFPLFAFVSGGQVTYRSCRVYSCKIWGDNNVLVRDFIPVRKGTVGYLYDRVSGKLFGNAGTGDFVVGPDVVPVEYIESHGTEWIDTGYKHSEPCEYIIDINGTPTSSDTGIFGSYATGTTGYNSVVLGFYNRFIYGFNYPSQRIDSPTYPAENDDFLISYKFGSSTRTLSVNGWTSTASGTAYNSRNVGVFASGPEGRYPSSIKCRYFKIKNASDETIHNYRPIRVGTDATSWEGAMMDVLTRRIYRNAGTGAFTYGNDLKYPIPAS